MPDSLESLVRELTNEPPINHCADDGDSCAFCGADYNHSANWPGGNGIPCKHSDDCWLNRARAALAALPS